MALGQRFADKLDAQDQGETEKGRKATDRGAYVRFFHAVADAHMTRFIHLDYDTELFSFSEQEDAIKKAEKLDGKLVLVTNVQDFDAQLLVDRYKALADIERGFRVLKSDIEIAPIFHRLPERIRAHALICFLALVLYRVMRLRLKAAGSTESPKSALRQLRRIQQHRVKVNGQCRHGISTLTAVQRELLIALQLPEPA